MAKPQISIGGGGDTGKRRASGPVDLVAFDVDGTLIREPDGLTVWEVLNRKFLGLSVAATGGGRPGGGHHRGAV